MPTTERERSKDTIFITFNSSMHVCDLKHALIKGSCSLCICVGASGHVPRRCGYSYVHHYGHELVNKYTALLGKLITRD